MIGSVEGGVRVYSRQAGRLPLCRQELIRCLCAMRQAVPGALPEGVELFCLRDGEMAWENARQMGCAGPTNILSFPGGDGMAGTLLISLDTLYRECVLYGQTARRHMIRLLAHGMGHLQGYDHGPDMDALCTRMEGAALSCLAGAGEACGPYFSGVEEGSAEKDGTREQAWSARLPRRKERHP